MNLSQFKKEKEDNKTVTMAHPKGHTITILKSKLSALQKKQIERLPIHAAQGAMIEEPDVSKTDTVQVPEQDMSVQSDQKPTSDEWDVTRDIKKSLAGDKELPTILGGHPGQIQTDQEPSAVDVPNSPLIASNGPLPEAVNPINASKEGAISSGTQPSQGADSSGGFDLNKSYQQGQQAITEQQNVSSQLAKKEAEIKEKDLIDRQALNDDIQKNSQLFQEQQKNFLDAYQNNKINPNHYQESMGSGQKISTAIGLLLGGFAGGINGTHVNPASDYIDQQIARDIKAQESRLDQQKTVLGANRELFQDQLLAQNATKINMNDIYDHKIQLEAAKLGTPQAKAIADAQHAKFSLENANLLQTNAIRSSALKAQENGTINDPSILIHALVPEHQQKEVAEEIAKRQNIVKNSAKILAAFDKAAEQWKITPWDRSGIRAFHQLLLPNFKAIDGTVRQAAMDETFHNLDPARGDVEATPSKRQGVIDWMTNESAAPLAKANHIDLDKFSSTRLNDIGKKQYKPGDIVYTKTGQKGQVLANGNIKAVK